MSLHPSQISRIPAESMRVAGAAFPHGTVVTGLPGEFADLYRDEDFSALYPHRGQPGSASLASHDQETLAAMPRKLK